MSLYYNCAECKDKSCLRGGEYPDNCPSVMEKETIDSAVEKVSQSETNKKIMAVSKKVSRNENGELNNRVEEFVQFCHIMGYKKIGVAFCAALSKEGKALCEILSDAEFSVFPVCCKVGRKSASDMGLEPGQYKGVSCNPVSQANILNSHKTDINVIVGLCMGHDILFSQNSDSPVTTIVVKDRALKNNPVQALQCQIPASV